MDTEELDQLLAQAKLPEKEVLICLRSDLQIDYEAATTELAAADLADKLDDSLAGGRHKLAAAKKVEALRERMLAASLTLRLRALPRRRSTALYAEHPPRDGDARDRVTGFNRDTFYEALTRESLFDPALSDVQWEKLADAMSAGQWDALTNAAWDVNRQGVDVPFSLAASLVLNTPELASERPTDSASASNGSKAGNPSPTTPMTTKAGSSPRARKANGTKKSSH